MFWRAITSFNKKFLHGWFPKFVHFSQRRYNLAFPVPTSVSTQKNYVILLQIFGNQNVINTLVLPLVILFKTKKIINLKLYTKTPTFPFVLFQNNISTFPVIPQTSLNLLSLVPSPNNPHFAFLGYLRVPTIYLPKSYIMLPHKS